MNKNLGKNDKVVKKIREKVREILKESKSIKALYKKAGMKPPKGKGIHTKKFHKCVTDVYKNATNKSEINPYAICMKNLGPEKAVKKSHRRNKNK